jgi:hypothetical protein
MIFATPFIALQGEQRNPAMLDELRGDLSGLSAACAG